MTLFAIAMTRDLCEPALPAPVLVVEDEHLLQQRLCGVLPRLEYEQDALLSTA